jgi:tetratricopeptide (TPR) repeat protein
VRKLFERVNGHLREFIAQRDAFALVVACRPPEIAYILKMLAALEEGGEPFLLFAHTHDFEGAVPYVQTIVDQFRERHTGVIKLQEEAGEKPWPALPGPVEDRKAPPAERLRALMVFSRGLLPSPQGMDVVWAFFPLQVRDAAGYADLFRALLPHEHPVPWCHHMRAILWQDPSKPVLADLPKTVGRTVLYPVDLGPAALEKALEEDAGDESMALAERLQNTLMLANLDYSHNRLPAALEKYKVLLKYHIAAGNPVMLALVLNGMGEVYNRMEKPPEAKQHFESALSAAAQGGSPVVSLNVILNLANLHLKHKGWADAEAYYDSAAKIARAQNMAETTVRSLENRGVCQYQQGKAKDALASWEEADTLAKAVEEPGLRVPVLKRLQEHYRKAGALERDRQVSRELQALA